jgi:hypothetical protein
VEWHLRQAWEPLLFEDEGLTEDRPRRDPVAPAKPSESAQLKKKTHTTPGGLPVQSSSDADGSSGDTLPEHVCDDGGPEPDTIRPGDGGGCIAVEGATVDQDVARNGEWHLA